MRRIINQKNFVEKLKKQNEKALEYVIHQYGGFVKAVVQRNLSGMPEEIEECMDDVFLDVWNHIDRFDDTKGTFLNWMLSIARFRSIDYLRRYSRICMEEDISRFENHLAKDQLLEMLEQEISKETEALLEGLCAQDRDILLRYYMEEFCLLNTREVMIKGDKNLVCGSMVTLKMKDGTKVVDVGGGVTFSADLDIASREAVFKVAADINQVESIQIDSEEMGTVIIPVNKIFKDINKHHSCLTRYGSCGISLKGLFVPDFA